MAEVCRHWLLMLLAWPSRVVRLGLNTGRLRFSTLSVIPSTRSLPHLRFGISSFVLGMLTVVMLVWPGARAVECCIRPSSANGRRFAHVRRQGQPSEQPCMGHSPCAVTAWEWECSCVAAAPAPGPRRGQLERSSSSFTFHLIVVLRHSFASGAAVLVFQISLGCDLGHDAPPKLWRS